MLAVAIAKYLTTLGIVTYDETLPTADCFIAHMPPDPDDTVMLTPVAGPKPDVKWGYDRPSVQVKIRSAAIREGEGRSQEIYDALHGLRAVTLDQDGPDEVRLLDCQAVQSPPYYLGTDDNGRHEWIINFDTDITAPTANRR